MSTDPTEYPRPLEPTEPVYYNPYEPTSPYNEDIPPIPPPPPRQSHKGLIITLVSILCLLAVILAGGLVIAIHATAAKPPALKRVNTTPLAASTAANPRPSPTLPIPTPTTVSTPIPTVDTNYTATDILSDFGKDGAPISDVTYGTTIWSFSDENYYVNVHATSSATWLDPPQTAGSASVGLWIYSSPSDAESAYTQVGNDETNPNTTLPHYLWPTEFLHGRCLLLITGYSSAMGPWQGYQQALSQYCV